MLEIIKIIALLCQINHGGRNPSSVEDGKKVYNKCYSCHGRRAEGNSGVGAPMLAGQHSWYIVKQIEYIRDGKRTSASLK